MTRTEAIGKIEYIIDNGQDYGYWTDAQKKALYMAITALEQETLPCDISKTFGVFIPEITVDEFRNAPLESIEDLLAMGEFHDIDLSGYQEPKRGTRQKMEQEILPKHRDIRRTMNIL